MIAGLVLLSAMVGLVATGGAIALSVPTWMALALYPVVCSLSLLMFAALGSLRGDRAVQSATLLRQQA